MMNDEELLTTSLKEELERAKNGDKLAARDVLDILSHLLSGRYRDSTGKRYPVPDYVLDYVSDALGSMAKGESGDRAFHLKKSGNQAWSYFEKRLAVNIVRQLVEQGLPVDTAVGTAADKIKEHIAQTPCPPAWRGFKGRTVSEATLLAWYYERPFTETATDS
ncbi:MAG: hypothetical protein V4446_13655 [Pseudomonadota bacterium]